MLSRPSPLSAGLHNSDGEHLDESTFGYCNHTLTSSIHAGCTASAQPRMPSLQHLNRPLQPAQDMRALHDMTLGDLA